MRERGSRRPDLEMLGPDALPLSRDLLQFGTPRYACLSGETEQRFRRFYAPEYLSGMRTVNCFRPFLRRRASVARPHFVSMRARNPCVLSRRVLRGR